MHCSAIFISSHDYTHVASVLLISSTSCGNSHHKYASRSSIAIHVAKCITDVFAKSGSNMASTFHYPRESVWR